jgi:hypothetical protein
MTHARNAPAARTAFVVALTVVVSVLTGFRAGVNPVTPGLDPSYSFAFNYAAVHGERWGTDFMTNRGPYGWVLYPMDVGDVASSWFVFQACLVLMVGVAAAAYVQTVAIPTIGRVALSLSLTYITHIAFLEEWRWFVLFLLILLLGCHRKDGYGFLAFALASTLGGFLLLMKLTIGPGALMALVAASLFEWKKPAVLARLMLAGGGAALGLLAGWVGHYGSMRGVATYLIGSWSMVAGYTSAASLAYEGWEWVTGSFLAFFAFLTVSGVLLGQKRTWLSLAVCSAALFAAWKHSVVRQDGWHGKVLVFVGFFVVAVIVTDSLNAQRRWQAAPALAGAVGSLVAAWLLLPPFSQHLSPAQDLAEAFTRPLKLPGVAGLRAVLGLKQYRESLAHASTIALEPLVLPAAERALVAGHTVDVYPWEAAYVAANQLIWANRPSPSSPTAHSTTIDRLNAAFFASNRRPRRLLWHRTDTQLLRAPEVTSVASIDGRHLFWDEPLTLLSILNHYQLVSTGSVFILALRPEPRFVATKPLGTVTVPWGNWTPVPDAPGVVLAEVRFRRPLGAEVRRLLLREGEMSVDVRFRKGGMTIGCLFVPNLAASGMWISPLPHSAEDLEVVLSGGLPEDARVAEIRFWSEWEPRQQPGQELQITWLALENNATGPR